MGRLKFGVRLPVSGPLASVQAIIQVAKEAEDLGFDSVWVHDHLMWSKEMHRHHISSGAFEALREGQDPDFYEAMTTLAFVAALTEQVKLGLACLVLPCRNPVYAAKQAANLDVLSKGRLIMGVGLGSMATKLSREFDVLKVPVKLRGELTDEYIRAIRELWTNSTASYEGKSVSFSDAEMFPKPVQKPAPPIWVGGWTSAARRRAARLGDGWIPGWLSSTEMRNEVAALRDEAKALGRNPDKVTIAVEKWVSLAKSRREALRYARPTITESLQSYERKVASFEKAEDRHIFGSADYVTSKIEEFSEAGVTHFEFKFIYPTIEHYTKMMRGFVKEVLPSFK